MIQAIPLPAIPTEASASVALPAEIEASLAPLLESWLDAPGWDARAPVADWLAALWCAAPPGADWRPHMEAGARLLTSLLEQLGEVKIRCAVQAVCYRASFHPAWRAAATQWLAAAPDADVAAFVDAHPALALLVTNTAALFGGEFSR